VHVVKALYQQMVKLMCQSTSALRRSRRPQPSCSSLSRSTCTWHSHSSAPFSASLRLDFLGLYSAMPMLFYIIIRPHGNITYIDAVLQAK